MSFIARQLTLSQIRTSNEVMALLNLVEVQVLGGNVLDAHALHMDQKVLVMNLTLKMGNGFVAGVVSKQN